MNRSKNKNNRKRSNQVDQRKTKQIFVGGCHPQIKNHELKNYFSQFGKVIECRLVKDKRTKKFRGFGFVTFSNFRAVEEVVKSRHHVLKGKKVETKKAFSKEESRVKLFDEKERKLYITGIAKFMTKRDLRGYFKRFGEVQDTRIIHDPEKNKDKGFGFVLFLEPDSLDRALSKGLYQTVKGCTLECRRTRLREEIRNTDQDGSEGMAGSSNGPQSRKKYSYGESDGFDWKNNRKISNHGKSGGFFQHEGDYRYNRDADPRQEERAPHEPDQSYRASGGGKSHQTQFGGKGGRRESYGNNSKAQFPHDSDISNDNRNNNRNAENPDFEIEELGGLFRDNEDDFGQRRKKYEFGYKPNSNSHLEKLNIKGKFSSNQNLQDGYNEQMNYDPNLSHQGSSNQSSHHSLVHHSQGSQKEPEFNQQPMPMQQQNYPPNPYYQAQPYANHPNQLFPNQNQGFNYQQPTPPINPLVNPAFNNQNPAFFKPQNQPPQPLYPNGNFNGQPPYPYQGNPMFNGPNNTLNNQQPCNGYNAGYQNSPYQYLNPQQQQQQGQNFNQNSQKKPPHKGFFNPPSSGGNNFDLSNFTNNQNDYKIPPGAFWNNLLSVQQLSYRGSSDNSAGNDNRILKRPNKASEFKSLNPSPHPSNNNSGPKTSNSSSGQQESPYHTKAVTPSIDYIHEKQLFDGLRKLNYSDQDDGDEDEDDARRRNMVLIHNDNGELIFDEEVDPNLNNIGIEVLDGGEEASNNNNKQANKGVYGAPPTGFQMKRIIPDNTKSEKLSHKGNQHVKRGPGNQSIRSDRILSRSKVILEVDGYVEEEENEAESTKAIIGNDDHKIKDILEYEKYQDYGNKRNRPEMNVKGLQKKVRQLWILWLTRNRVWTKRAGLQQRGMNWRR